MPEGDTEPQAMLETALGLRLQGEWRQALDLLYELFELGPAPLAEADLRFAFGSALSCAAELKAWPETERLARVAVSRFPDHAGAYERLGEALFQQDRPDEAQDPLARALEIAPGRLDARALLALIRRGEAPIARTRPVRTWPVKLSYFDDPRFLISKYLLRGLPEDRFIRPDSAFMTLGSCFAQNVAKRLSALGYQTHSENIGEDVNSTFANRSLLEWIEHGARDEPTSVMEEVYGPVSRERLRGWIERSEVFVLTLGLAACFFREDDGAFAFLPVKSYSGRNALMQGHVMRTTSVAENVANLEAILGSLRRLAGKPTRLVLTVSPVPLGATTEFPSAILADCVSKSTLRLACEEVVTTRAADGVVYWPSFEIVRWLGAHYGKSVSPAYGVDDGNSRHVSQWLVDLIMDLFVEHHAMREEQ